MKILPTLFFLVLSLNATIIVSAENLPQISKEFLQKHFKAPIALVQKDEKNYEVYLSDGTELEFDSTGAWKEIESGQNALSYDLLPPHIAAVMRGEFESTTMKELERKINYYKIKLQNGFKVLIDFNGTILRKKWD